MKKIFILGGSSLQMDLILEAKKMFFYTIVLDMNKDCIGANWCDEFLNIDIADKKLVLKKAREYKIDMILASATELGNITACYVGEKLKLSTNSYQTALNTTNKVLMKEIFIKTNIPTAKYITVAKDDEFIWDTFPCVVKPSDSSAGRGVYYCIDKTALQKYMIKSLSYSKNKQIIIEKYIRGEQFSVETITTDKKHQIITITKEFIRNPPNIVETHQTIPANIDILLKQKIEQFALNVLNIFGINYGACHIEIKVDENENIFIIEIASRIGGWRTEMLNLSSGISYSKLLILSSLNIYKPLNTTNQHTVTVKLILDTNDYNEYLINKDNQNLIIFEPIPIKKLEHNFFANNLIQAKGYYFIMEKIL